MKYLLFAMLMFWGVNCFGQVTLYTSIDKFTGDTTIETKSYPIVVDYFSKKDSVVGYSVTGYLHKTNGKKSYNLAIRFNPNDVMSIDKGDVASFKTSTGEIVQALYVGGYEIYSKEDKVFYYVDITDGIDKLKNGEITNIRLTTGNGNRDVELKDHRFLISKLVTALIEN